MKVKCPRCGNVREYVRGIGTQMTCNKYLETIQCKRSLTVRHEVKGV